MKADAIKKSLGAFKSVSSMTSTNNNDVPNQFIINFENGQVFQSYKSIVAIEFNSNAKESLKNKIVIGADFDYSNTTMRYLKEFLCNGGVADTRKKIKTGEYIYCEDL